MITGRRREIQSLVVRMQDAFLDAPALRLTVPQAQQRFGAGKALCEAVLRMLVGAGVLARTAHGQYVRFYPHAARRAAA